MEAAPNHTSEAATNDYRKLDIGQIEPYDRNPRFLPNPKRKDLKASLRASRGFRGVLPVTRRPGAKTYIVQKGGNTTLSLLKELFSETKDDAYRFVAVDISDWTGDFEVMIEHYRENNIRGDLSFGERSQEMVALFRQYCDDLGSESEPPTATQFLSHLADAFGITLAKSNFSLYRYAAETLEGAMPFLVRRTRFTRAQATSIRTLQTRIRMVWRDKGVGTRQEFDEIFFAHLTRIDEGLEETFAGDVEDDPTTTIEFDEADLVSALQNEFTRSEAVDCTFSEAGVWIKAALRAGPETVGGEADDALERTASSAPFERGVDASRHATTAANGETGPEDHPPGDEPDADSDVSQVTHGDGLAETLSPPTDHDDLIALRRKSFGYASRIAARNSLQDLLVQVPDIGFGYLIADAHEDVLQPASGALSHRAAAWWALAAGCSLSITPETVRDRHMPEDSFLRTALDQGNLELLVHSLPFQSFDQSGRLWSAMKVKDWSDYLVIQKIYKAITSAAHGHSNLWESNPSV